LGIDPGKFALIPGGVDEALAHRCAYAAKQTRRTSARRVVWAGRFVAFKGLDVLLQAIHQIEDQVLELVLIGDGPLLPTVRERVRQLTRATGTLAWRMQSTREPSSPRRRRPLCCHLARGSAVGPGR
jgi:glycosyltransferase involved in cell wall biosynthesis